MQLPVTVLNTNTKRETGKKAQFANIAAAKASCWSRTHKAMRCHAELQLQSFAPRAWFPRTHALHEPAFAVRRRCRTSSAPRSAPAPCSR